jgi:surface polysaccharide O-acyltransferase-like enzyme
MKQRIDYLDNLRAALTILVIVFHTSIAYGAAGSWILVDVDTNKLTVTSILLTIFTAVCQAFFMGLFFFLSSYFVPGSFDRKGAGQFLKDRLLRLGIPLAIYYFVIGPVTGWFARSRGTVSLGEFYFSDVLTFRQTFFGPAWFLEASLYFALLYVGYRLIAGSWGKTNETSPTVCPFPNGFTLIVVSLGLGLIAFAVRLLYPTGTGLLELQFGYFSSYILLFIAGIFAYRYNWLESIPNRTVRQWGWAAVIAIPVLPVGLILTGALDGHIVFAGGWNVQALLYALWEPVVCFGIILTLLRWFRCRFQTAGPLRKWMSAHAYTVYLIHPAVVVGWTIAFHGIDWPPAIKWVVVSALSVAVCFLIAGALRRIPGAKRVL